MEEFEIVYAKVIEANDFFDAVEKAMNEGAEVLTVSRVPVEVDDVYDG